MEKEICQLNIRQKCKGSVTVFLAGILAVIITFTGCMIDYTRIKMAQVYVNRACDAAAYSVLSGYSKDLEESYGLLSLYGGTWLESKGDMALRVMENNLNITTKGMDLFDFKIEDSNVTPMVHFLYPDTMKSQVVSFMKYRAPVETVHSVFEQLDILSRLGDTVKGMNVKIRFEKKIYKIEKSLLRLEEITDKLSKFNMVRVNGLTLLQAYKTLFGLRISMECIQFVLNQMHQVNIRTEDDWSTVKDQIDSLNGWAGTLALCGAGMVTRIQVPDNPPDTDKDRIKVITQLQRQAQGLINETVQSYSGLDRSYKTMHSEMTNMLICTIYDCDEAITLCNEISVKAKEAKHLAQEGAEVLQEDQSLAGQEMKLEFEKVLKALRVDDTGTIIKNVTENRNGLTRLLSMVNCLPTDVYNVFHSANTMDVNLILRSGGDKIDCFKEILESYKDKDILFNYPKKPEQEGGSNDTSSDPRSKVKDDVKQVTSKNNGKDYVTIGRQEGEPEDMLDALPSRLMKTMVNQAWMFVGDEADFSEDDTEGTPENGLEAASNLLAGFKDIASRGWNDLIEEIYFNEYILQVMKNCVTGSEDAGKKANKAEKGDMARKDYLDIRGNLLSDGTSYFKEGEVEYVLVGNASESVNIAAVKSEILAIRFAMNLLGAYMDKEKSAIASSIAVSMAGWTVAGVPLLKTLIMCAWSLAESVTDIIKLTDGKTVPFYKTDFYLDFGLSDIGKTIENVIEKATEESLESVEKSALDNGKDLLYKIAENVVDEYLLEKGFYTVSENLYEQLEWQRTEDEHDSDRVFPVIRNYIYEWLQGKYNSQIEGMTDKINDLGENMKETIMESLEVQLDEHNPTGLYRKITVYLESINKNLADIAGSAVGSLFTYDVLVESSGQSGTSMLPLSYNDYMRLLLLLQGSDKTLYRTLDLIQLNMQKNDHNFYMSNQNTFVTVKVEVSIPYLFPTG
ncbi:MAG TPA: hypothetical protein DDZ89_14065, partial [Clostridiales bacterium]|nr:hypothetical protein [Clostridiales bacterium]